MKPRVWFWCACLFLLSTRLSAGQTYQGGIRGQVRDQQGVIPGVEVTLLNEAMNTGRTIVTNEVGEFAFANVLPGSYSIKAALTGFKTEERKGVTVATQQLLVMDFTLQVGEFSEQITVSGESADPRTHDADGGDVARPELPASPADLRAEHVLRGGGVAERDCLGRPAVRAHAGPVGRLVAVARRRAATRQRLSARRRADHRSGQSRDVHPLDRSGRGHAGAGQDLRRGDGPCRGRRLQHDREVRIERLARQHGVHQQAAMGDRESLFRQGGRTAEAAAVLLRLGGLARRSGRQEQDLLLGERGRLPTEEHPQQRPDVADGTRASGRLLADAGCAGTAGRSLRSADDQGGPEQPRAVHPRSLPREQDPGRPAQSGRAGDAGRHADTGAPASRSTATRRCSTVRRARGR